MNIRCKGDPGFVFWMGEDGHADLPECEECSSHAGRCPVPGCRRLICTYSGFNAGYRACTIAARGCPDHPARCGSPGHNRKACPECGRDLRFAVSQILG